MTVTEPGVRSAYWMLRLTFGLVPIVAGLDKFTNILCDWSRYLAPQVRDLLPLPASAIMLVVGMIEVLAGALVLSRATRLGATLVAFWLVAIAGNLVLDGKYDIAVRDLVMAVSALALTRLDLARRSVVVVVPPSRVVGRELQPAV
jgi:uncharacterized membrane protein YphA (DoxX/SURF4 family)